MVSGARRVAGRLGKLPLVLAAVAFLGIATVALAVTNTYRVSASSSAKKAGRVGPTNDPSNQDLHCYLDLTLYNAAKNHVTLYLKGRTANAAPKDCVMNTDVAIDASYVRSGTSTTLSFTVPPTLLHPVPGLDNAVRNVTAKIKKITSGKGKKRLAYYSSVGGCTNNKRAVTVTFVPESGTTQTAPLFAKCTR